MANDDAVHKNTNYKEDANNDANTMYAASILPCNIKGDRLAGVIRCIYDDGGELRRSFLRARRVKLLVTLHKTDCRNFKIALFVCLFVNNAARCRLPVLSAI